MPTPRYTVGSILQFTPETSNLIATFRTSDEDTELKVIGWAVVVRWTTEEPTDQNNEIETEIQAVVLDDGHPSTTSTYIDDRHDGTTFVGTSWPAQWPVGGRA